VNLLPPSVEDLSDDDLVALYSAAPAPAVGTVPGGGSAPAADGPGVGLEARGGSDTSAAGWIRVNFVSTLDGAASAEGVTGSLGGPDDLRVFDLLRRITDVVLVAAGTVRDEGYGPMRLHDADVAWRREHGLPDHPVFAIVTGSLSLDPASSVFTDAPVRPLVLTSDAADPGRRSALAAVADVVSCGEDSVDVRLVRDALVSRGLGRIHCEGGPSFLGSLVAADLVDELCLSVDPSLEGGEGPRIVRGSTPELRRMRLAHVLRGEGDLLLTRYVRSR
jgi:riboflavin biosynthesis pyrimidine reductase